MHWEAPWEILRVPPVEHLLPLARIADGDEGVADLVGLGQSALSQHLARLRHAGVVATRRDGQSIYYSIADGEITTVMAALHAAFCATPADDVPPPSRP